MILKHLRANVVAYLALFLALTSTSYAAAQIANGSVTTKKLAKDAVTSAKIDKGAVGSSDLANNSVSGPTVKNGSLVKADLAAGTLPKLDFLQVNPTGTTPLAVPEAFFLAQTVTLPRAGDLLARLDVTALAVDCASGNSTMGIYVDGDSIPGTGRAGSGTGTPRTVNFVAAVPLTAGLHTFEFGADCTSDDMDGLAYNGGSPTWTFALIGE